MKRGRVVIQRPLFTNTAHVIRVEVYADERWKTPSAITGNTVKVYINDAGGTTKDYTVTNLSTVAGVTCAGSITLTGASHTTAGTFQAQLHIDDIPVERFTGEFVLKLS